ncbi:MAG TPA: DUF5993 family protein [Dongiaceae bacterium]|nr:DUF5993 family protein [Dongiaceae bacterium]
MALPQPMVMVLPFAVGLLSVLLAAAGQRAAAIWAWVATMVVLLAWLKVHATTALSISL